MQKMNILSIGIVQPCPMINEIQVKCRKCRKLANEKNWGSCQQRAKLIKKRIEKIELIRSVVSKWID